MNQWGVVASTGLAAELDRYGLGLEPGQRVITGALGRFDVAPGEQWRASFDGVGDVAIRAR
jgi:2-keto-4-pentenoate hydratase